MLVQDGAEPVDEGDGANVHVRLFHIRRTGAAGLRVCRLCAITRKKMRSTMFSTAPWRFIKQRSRLGTDSTHWRTGRQKKTWTVGFAVVSTIRLVLHEGHTLRPLQEKARK